MIFLLKLEPTLSSVTTEIFSRNYDRWENQNAFSKICVGKIRKNSYKNQFVVENVC